MQPSDYTWAELETLTAHQLTKSRQILIEAMQSENRSPEKEAAYQAAYDSHHQLLSTYVEIFGMKLETVH